MRFQPKFDSQFFSRSLQERVQQEARSDSPPAAEFSSGLRVGGEMWLPVSQSDTDLENAAPNEIPEDSPQMPEPGPWLADLLQQRKEMKS